MTGLALVVAGGARAEQVCPPIARGADLVVAADSGTDLARDLGLRVDVVVGDLDSVSPDGLAWARDGGAEVCAVDADKDQTDLELALTRAVAARPDRLLVLGGAGGRLDHLLANVAVCCGPITRMTPTEAWMGTAHLFVVRDQLTITESVGDTVSLLAWHGDAVGVTTLGMRWPLRGETLHGGEARGTSNEIVADPAGVAIDGGVLSVVIDQGADRTNEEV